MGGSVGFGSNNATATGAEHDVSTQADGNDSGRQQVCCCPRGAPSDDKKCNFDTKADCKKLKGSKNWSVKSKKAKKYCGEPPAEKETAK